MYDKVRTDLLNNVPSVRTIQEIPDRDEWPYGCITKHGIRRRDLHLLRRESIVDLFLMLSDKKV